MTVFIGMPATGHMPTACVESLLQLEPVPGMGYCVDPSSSSIAAKRNNLVSVFLRSPLSHLLFLDSDMVFPRDIVRRLLAARQPVVGALYFSRQLPPTPLAGWYTGDRDPATFYRRAKPGEGLQAVDFVGAGALLVERRVFQRLAAPWFEETVESHPAGSRTVYEDENFCVKARAAGFGVYCDTDLVAGHVTSVVIDRSNAENLGWVP